MSSPDAKRLLVTAAGTATGYGLLSAARARWGRAVRLIAADVNPPHLLAASALADETVRLPLVASPEFPAALEALLRRVDVYAPLLDEEIVLAAGLKTSALVCAPSAPSAALCLDKLALHDWMVARGIPTPKTASAPFAAPGGLIVKPRRGRGSLGFREGSPTETLGPDLLAQERCAGSEVTVDLFRGAGLRRALCRERLEVKAGVCTKARLHHDPEAEAIAFRVADGLDLPGTSCVQLMGGRGSWKVTDVNPRPGAGTSMSLAAGQDFLCAHLAWRGGDDPKPFFADVEGELFVVRAYHEHVFRA